MCCQSEVPHGCTTGTLRLVLAVFYLNSWKVQNQVSSLNQVIKQRIFFNLTLWKQRLTPTHKDISQTHRETLAASDCSLCFCGDAGYLHCSSRCPEALSYKCILQDLKHGADQAHFVPQSHLLLLKLWASDPHLKGYRNQSETLASVDVYLLMCVFYMGSVYLD